MTTIDHFTRIRFLDFEACSVSAASWPIEIGVSRLLFGEEGVSVATWDSTIRPHTSWPISEWSEKSAKVHHIPFNELLDGPDAIDVAEKAFEELRGCVVLSDAPPYETLWLDRLLALIGREGEIFIEDFHAASFSSFSGRVLDDLYEFLERHRAPHRAGRDSARLARSWMRALVSDAQGPLGKM